MQPVNLQVAGFVYDEVNESHMAKHGVAKEDTDEVLGNAPQFFENSPRSYRSASHLMLGPNIENRYLLAAIVYVSDARWRPLTAHWIGSRAALRNYKRTEQ